MSKARRRLTICRTCGRRKLASVGTTRCSHAVTSASGWRTICDGQLVPYKRPAKAKAPRTPQAVAARKHREALAGMRDAATRLKRVVTSLSMWQRREEYYRKKAQMTDAQVAAETAERQRRDQERRQRKAGRAITIKE